MRVDQTGERGTTGARVSRALERPPHGRRIHNGHQPSVARGTGPELRPGRLREGVV